MRQRHHDEGRGGKQLVGERVQKATERGLLVELASDITVREIRYARDEEDQQREAESPFPDQVKKRQRESDPKNREQVCGSPQS